MRIRRIVKSRRHATQRVYIFTIVTLLMITIILSLFALLRQVARSDSVPYAPPRQQTMTIGPPVQLSIPSIKVDARIAYAGLTANGTMDIKKNPDEVAWYKLGVRPGETGNAVIAGHYGWTGDHGSIFNNLHLLRLGDEVSVLDQNGTTTTFRVTGNKMYNPASDATSIFQSHDNKQHLNLITCDGVWSNANQTYSDRLVVFTDRVVKN